MSAFEVLILTTPLHGSSGILWVDTQITGSCSNSCPCVFTAVVLPANYIKTSTNMAPVNRFPPFAPVSIWGAYPGILPSSSYQDQSPCGRILSSKCYPKLPRGWMHTRLPAFQPHINLLCRNTYRKRKLAFIFSLRPMHLSAPCHEASRDISAVRQNSVH